MVSVLSELCGIEPPGWRINKLCVGKMVVSKTMKESLKNTNAKKDPKMGSPKAESKKASKSKIGPPSKKEKVKKQQLKEQKDDEQQELEEKLKVKRNEKLPLRRAAIIHLKGTSWHIFSDHGPLTMMGLDGSWVFEEAQNKKGVWNNKAWQNLVRGRMACEDQNNQEPQEVTVESAGVVLSDEFFNAVCHFRLSSLKLSKVKLQCHISAKDPRKVPYFLFQVCIKLAESDYSRPVTFPYYDELYLTWINSSPEYVDWPAKLGTLKSSLPRIILQFSRVNFGQCTDYDQWPLILLPPSPLNIIDTTKKESNKGGPKKLESKDAKAAAKNPKVEHELSKQKKLQKTKSKSNWF